MTVDTVHKDCRSVNLSWLRASLKVHEYPSQEMVVNSLWETSAFFGGGNVPKSKQSTVLEIIASICQGCFAESALVRPKKFGNPTSHQIPDTSPEGHQNKLLVNGDIVRHEGHAISIALDGAKQKS